MVAGAVVCAAMLVVPSMAAAQDGTEEAEPIAEPPVRIAIAPSHVRAFAPSGLSPEATRRLHERLRRGAVRYVANHPEQFNVVTPSQVSDVTRSQAGYQRKLEVAEGWAEMGVASYKQLNFEDAVERLEKAVEAYDDVRHQFVDPGRVAEVMMYLSLSYLSSGGNAARPLTLIRRMVLLEPSRKFREGYYPEDIVSFYESTRDDALARLRDRGPAPERATWLAEEADADWTAFVYAFPLDDQSGESADSARYELGLWLYSASRGEMLEVRRIGAPDSNEPGVPPERLTDASNRLMSRIGCCVYEAPEPSRETLVTSSGQSPYSVNIGFAYASYLRYPEPIDRPFGNIGFDFGASAQLTREFGIVIGGHVLSSLRDYSGRLVDGFTSMRFFAGPDLGVQIGPVNLGGHLALEVAGTGPYAVCTNLDALATGCEDPSNRRAFGNHIAAGLNARPRVQVELVPSFSIAGGASISYFVVPFPERRLGFPISFDVGVRYRF